MPIAVRQRQVMPTGATKEAPKMPIGVNDPVYNAQQGFINQSVDLAVQLHQKMAAVDMMSEWSDFEGFVNQQRADAEKFRKETVDSDLPNGKTVYGDDWDKRVVAISDYANKNLRYGDTKQKALNHITTQKGVWDWQLNNDAFASRTDTALKKFDEYQNTVMTVNYSTDLLAENSARKQQGLPQLSDKEYRLKLIEQRANELASTGLINQRGIPDLLARADTALSKAESENKVKIIENQLAGIAEETGSWEQSLAILAMPKFQKKTGLDSKQIDSMIEDVNSKINIEKKAKQIEFNEQVKTASEEAEKLLLDPAADSRQIIKLIPQLPDNLKTKENETTQGDIDQRLRDFAEAKRIRDEKGLPITEPKAYNQSVNALLSFYEDLDSKVFNDTINNNWLGISRVKDGKEMQDTGKLSDSDRAKLLKLAGKEMPYSTLQGIKEAVGFGKEKMPNFWTGKEKDQTRISEYNRALIDWIDNNTDPENKKYPSADEVFKQSRILYGLIKSPPVKPLRAGAGDPFYFETPEEKNSNSKAKTPRQWEKGDVRTVKGKTYTFNGVDWD